MPAVSPLLSPVLKKGVSWHIEWYFEVNGQRRRIRKSQFNGIELNSIADLREREIAADLMLHDLKARLQPPALVPEQTPFLEALEIAVELKRSAKWRTNKSFGEVVRWFSEFFRDRGWHYLRCSQVTQQHVQAYFDHCIVKLKVANSTHNTRKNNLRSVFGELVKRGYFPENYVAQVPERQTGDPIRRPLSADEKQVLADYIFKNDPPLTLAFLLLSYLAIRPGEMRDLRVGSIDLKNGFIRFPGAQSKNNRDSVVTIPKQAMPVLEALHLEKYPPSYYLFGRGKGRNNKNLLPASEQIGVNTLASKFQAAVRALERAGKLHNTTGIQFYSLKDTLAIYLLDNGVDVESAMRHFRHSDLAVFQRYVKRLGVENEKIRDLPMDLKLPGME